MTDEPNDGVVETPTLKPCPECKHPDPHASSVVMRIGGICGQPYCFCHRCTDTAEEERAVLTELLAVIDDEMLWVDAGKGPRLSTAFWSLIQRAREVLARREKEGKDK